MERNYYMVRAMESRKEDFEVFFQNGVVAVGWSEVNFSDFARSESKQLRGKVNEIYYLNKNLYPSTVGKKLNEVERFHNINEGDYIIVPYYNKIRLAIAKNKRGYNENTQALDLSNQIKVNYLGTNSELKTISRDYLSEGLQRRLRVRGSTVSNLYEFAEEIEKIFQKEIYSWNIDYEEKENSSIEVAKATLLMHIQNGVTNLATGGIGLERLVKELFECEGYNANILSKNHFEGYGDADVYATKSDKFQEIKILAQVKHHSGYTDTWGIEQLSIIQQDNAYEDYKFILITSALINNKVKEKANSRDINTMDGEELVEWIFEHIEDLEQSTKAGLGISTAPQIII